MRGSNEKLIRFDTRRYEKTLSISIYIGYMKGIVKYVDMPKMKQRKV
jgi:hypothetical protein